MLIHLRERHDVERLRGRRPEPGQLARLAEDGDALYKPDGSPLLLLRRGAVSAAAAAAAYPWLHSLRRHGSDSRASYTGVQQAPLVRLDGQVSQTTRAKFVPSVAIGYFDRTPRYPFCRTMAIVSQEPEGWGSLAPLIQEVSTLFRELLPRRHAAQMEAARRSHPTYVIRGTPFTTLTVNNTLAAAYHKDRGDYAAGFGCMLVLRRGEYTGGELVLPAYQVGVDLRDRDLVLFDVHQYHGNLPIVGVGPAMLPEKGGHERISIVFYFREKMVACLPPAEELLRAKDARGRLG